MVVTNAAVPAIAIGGLFPNTTYYFRIRGRWKLLRLFHIRRFGGATGLTLNGNAAIGGSSLV